MKKGWKIFWIICGIVASVGIILCMAGAIMGATFGEVEMILGDGITIGGLFRDAHNDASIGDNMEDGLEYGYEYGERAENPDSRDSYSGIEELDMDVAGVVIQLLPSEDEKVYVETADVDPRLQYDCRQDEDTLEIRTTKKLRLINRIKGDAATVWIYLPEKELQKISISNEAGAVYAETVNAREFHLDVGAGEGILDDFTVQKAQLDCGAGQITATGTVLDELSLDCGLGEIDLTILGREEDYRYEVDCGIGEVHLGERQFSGIGVEQSGNSSGGRELNIDCGVGSVTVVFAE